MKKLVGNVFICDMNTDEILIENLFDQNGTFNGGTYQLGYTKDRKAFDAILKSELQSAFGSRCQYEILMSGLFNNSKNLKIDVYGQVMANGDRFEEYCGNNKILFKNFKKDGIEIDNFTKRFKKVWRESHKNEKK